MADRRSGGKSAPAGDDDRTAELLRRSRAGDKDALSELVLRDLEWVEGRVRGNMANLRHFVRTSDVVQELFVRLLAAGTPPESVNMAQLRAYLAEAIRNLLCTQAGKSVVGKKPGAPLLTIMDHIEDGRSAAPYAEALFADEHERVKRALALLRGREQDLIRGRTMRGASFAVLGTAFGLSEDAARMAYKRALNRLRAKLAEISQDAYEWPTDYPKTGDDENGQDGKGGQAGEAAN